MTTDPMVVGSNPGCRIFGMDSSLRISVLISTCSQMVYENIARKPECPRTKKTSKEHERKLDVGTWRVKRVRQTMPPGTTQKNIMRNSFSCSAAPLSRRNGLLLSNDEFPC